MLQIFRKRPSTFGLLTTSIYLNRYMWRIKLVISWLIPPKEWQLPVSILLGIFFGLGAYTIYISNAVSYLTDDPKTCVNCHVMGPQYATWNHSSHREHATCMDCHVPHDNIFNTYFFKAKDGLRHSYMFTLRLEPQVIRIKEEGRAVVLENCRRCHNDLLANPKLICQVKHFEENRFERACIDCHRHVPHGRVNSLSSTPNARIYNTSEGIVPEWLQQEMTKHPKKK